MGLYDRDYLREEEGFHLGGGQLFQSMTTKIVVVTSAIYLVHLLLPQLELMERMEASPESLAKPWLWWQLLTAGFAHDPRNINHILFNMFCLWFGGQQVERVRGSVEFLLFYLAAIVFGNVLFAARGLLFLPPIEWHPVVGASGGVVAVLILFVCYFPNSTLLLFFVIPVKGWVFGVILIAMDVLGALGSRDNVAYDVHLAGAAFALAYWRLGWSFSRLAPRAALDSLTTWFSRPRLKVHRPESDARRLDAEADRILAKLHAQGEASLTARERRTLEEYSRRLRDRR
jgi:membrane associated rhomboid family serine protease